MKEPKKPKEPNKPNKGNGKITPLSIKKDNQLLQKEGEDLFKNAVLANSLETIKNNLGNYLQQIFLLNKLRKAKYDNLIKEGFTEVQALEIIIRTKILE